MDLLIKNGVNTAALTLIKENPEIYLVDRSYHVKCVKGN